jgi:hypothetical protein
MDVPLCFPCCQAFATVETLWKMCLHVNLVPVDNPKDGKPKYEHLKFFPRKLIEDHEEDEEDFFLEKTYLFSELSPKFGWDDSDDEKDNFPFSFDPSDHRKAALKGGHPAL